MALLRTANHGARGGSGQTGADARHCFDLLTNARIANPVPGNSIL